MSRANQIAVHFSSLTPEWATPQWLFDALNGEFGFTLDPCCTHKNAKCSKHFTKTENGLLKSWRGHTVFMNPPYGKEIGAWMHKAYAESRRGAVVVCLIPARTDTKWWHDVAMKGEIRFWRGRLKFGGGTDSAPFPSAVVVLRPPEFHLCSMHNGAKAPASLRRDEPTKPLGRGRTSRPVERMVHPNSTGNVETGRVSSPFTQRRRARRASEASVWVNDQAYAQPRVTAGASENQKP